MIGSDLSLARQLLEDGKVVALPTDTVYGLAANVYDETAVATIFSLKGRPRERPLIVLVDSLRTAGLLCDGWDEPLRTLAMAYWPGPLTLLLPRPACVPSSVVAASQSLGLRVPNHPLTLSLLGQLSFPVVATSANPFRSPSPITAKHVQAYFGDGIPYILDGGPCPVGVESTILGKRAGGFVVHRLGAISLEALRRKIGELPLALLNESAAEKDS